MKFSDGFLNDIRTKLPIHVLIGEYVIWDKKKTQVRKGDYWACCPFHGEKSPSFHADDRKGIYHCFGCQVTGDVFKFLTERQHMTFPEAVERAARMAGIPMPEREDRRAESDEDRAAREALVEEDRKVHAAHVAELERQQEERESDRIDMARRILSATSPLRGTLGEGYFIGRGLAPMVEWPWDPGETIRFHPSLVYELDKSLGKFPAVIGKVVDAFGELCGIWRIYLDRVKPTKAPVDNPKVGMGPASGGAVRIGGDAPYVDVSEGMETALAAWELNGFKRPSWSLLSTSGMVAFEPPIFIKKVRTWPDGDPARFNEDRSVLTPPGMRAARALRDRLVAVGIENPINEMTRHGDALDLLATRKRQEKHG